MANRHTQLCGQPTITKRNKKGECCACAVVRAKQWRLAHPERSHELYQAANWRHRGIVGFTPEDYHARFTAQRGVCAICGKPTPQGCLSVDHDHTTGSVRGLLCRGCNGSLGWLEKFEAAIDHYRAR